MLRLLARLVDMRVWEAPEGAGKLLWAGFVRLSLMLAPDTYGIVLSLPKERLKMLLASTHAVQSGLAAKLAAVEGRKVSRGNMEVVREAVKALS